jgi:tetratricopeptide (TPR) repeat protein
MPVPQFFRPKFVFAALAVATLMLSMTGCADMITFAQETREKGIKAYDAGDYALAAGTFRSALKQDPRDYLSDYYLGLSSLQLKNYSQALVSFRSCLDNQNLTLAGREDNATRIKALDGLAQAIVQSGNGDLEVNKVEQAARSAQGPAAAREFFILAKVYRYRKLPDMALDYYNRAALADPKNFDYAKEYGLYCEQLQQVPKAREVLRQAYAIDNRDQEVNQALVRLGIVLGPGLKDKSDLVAPPLPKGPIPEVKFGRTDDAGGPVKQVTPSNPPVMRTVTTPRD